MVKHLQINHYNSSGISTYTTSSTGSDTGNLSDLVQNGAEALVSSKECIKLFTFVIY